MGEKVCCKECIKNFCMERCDDEIDTSCCAYCTFTCRHFEKDIRVDCNLCKHISLTEDEQNKLGTKVIHTCTKLKIVLNHGDRHPKLAPYLVKQCNDFEYREDTK